MTVNNRVFYACQAVGFIKRNAQTNDATIDEAKFLQGVQSVGVNRQSTSRQLDDFGRFQKKFYFEGKQEYSITISRVIDKSVSPFYVTNSYANNYLTNHILSADNLGVQGEVDSQDKCLRNYDIVILYGPDTQTNIDGSDPKGVIMYRNCLMTNLSYDISVGGQITENITLTAKTAEYNDGTVDIDTDDITFPESANILKPADFDTINSVLPPDISTLFGVDAPALQSISIELNIEYTKLDDVGRWTNSQNNNIWAFVNLPLSITTSFTGISKNIYPTRSIPLNDTSYDDNNEIKIVLDGAIDETPNNYIWDLGKRNYVSDIGISGGDTSGGNVELTISYTNQYSDFVIAKDSAIHDVTTPTTTF